MAEELRDDVIELVADSLSRIIKKIYHDYKMYKDEHEKISEKEAFKKAVEKNQKSLNEVEILLKDNGSDKNVKDLLIEQSVMNIDKYSKSFNNINNKIQTEINNIKKSLDTSKEQDIDTLKNLNKLEAVISKSKMEIGKLIFNNDIGGKEQLSKNLIREDMEEELELQ